ncbi:hypothetical protein ABIB25_001401 [Nakamurella sp. UYEF19]|uniref:hypothetical protein n=1 Tax=Nakamurella sp. UYEF19 TaxID=1756392 RepID=UPI0033965B6C
MAAVVPVVTGEFGEEDGTADYLNTYMTWADNHDVGYLAWAWWVVPEEPLALLTNDNGTPRAPLGTAVRTHLLARPPPTAPSAGTLTPMFPARLIDTRATGGPVAAGGTLSVRVSGRGGVPNDGVSAVAVDVTITAPTGTGYVTGFASGAARPGTSNLNHPRGRTISGLMVLPVGPDGKILLYNGSAGTAQMIVDVAGYYHAGPAATAGTLRLLAPTRLLDTRLLSTRTDAAVDARDTIALQVAGRGGLPAGKVAAVALTVTAVTPEAAGYLTVYGDARPTASTLNFVSGQTVANVVFVPVGTDGKVHLYNGSAGRTQFVVDLFGYIVAGMPTVTGAFRPIGPTRVLDTRIPRGATAAVPPSGEISVQVGGVAGVPLTGASSVMVNITAVTPAADGYLTAHPTGSVRPRTSILGFVAAGTIADLVIMPLGVDGKIQLYNGSAGATPLVADVVGYFLDGA